MANIKYELATKVTRGEKERWQKIGVVFMGERGPYAIIDNIPVGFTGMVSFFEPKEREQTDSKPDVQRSAQGSTRSNDLHDDIPFAPRKYRFEV